MAKRQQPPPKAGPVPITPATAAIAQSMGYIEKDPEHPVDLSAHPPGGGAPFVDPAVAANPEVLAYQAGMRARAEGRRRSPLPKKTVPVGGAPMPPIPNLGGEHRTGLTMAQQAMMERRDQELEAAQHMPQPAPGAPQETTILQELPTQLGARPTPQQPSPQADIRPGDLLPDEAVEDPAFIQAMGSRLAASQPQLALKYGVIREGKRIPAQMLTKGEKQLRPETVQDIRRFVELQERQQAQAQAQASGLPQTEEEATGQVSEAARVASMAGNLPGDSTEGDQKRPGRAVDELDFDVFRQRMMRDLLNNDSQKGIIEARLDPLRLEDLILQNRVRQVVPVQPGIFEPEFQSSRADEDLAIKRLIMDESKTVEVSDRYLLDKYAIMGLTIGVYAINGKPLGQHLDTEGNFSDEAFWTKFNRLCRLPVHMIASLAAQYWWFELRVRQLFVAEKVGNG